MNSPADVEPALRQLRELTDQSEKLGVLLLSLLGGLRRGARPKPRELVIASEQVHRFVAEARTAREKVDALLLDC